MVEKQGVMGVSADADRAGGLRPEPASQSQPCRALIADAVRDCEFPGRYSGCGRCAACVSIHNRRAARAAPFAHLIAQQSDQRCRVCQRIERYCQTDGQGRGRHAFSPRLTCESCVHMGERYWGSNDYPSHFCAKRNERRAANFRSTGDFAEDFMREFRTFYDAGPKQSADDCAFFEPRAAQGMEARQGGDANASPSRSDESAVGRQADAPDPPPENTDG